MTNLPFEQAKVPPKSGSDKAKQQSMWQRLLNGILRPPRSNYKQSSLGSKVFVLNETKYERKDTMIKHEEKVITLSMFEPQYRSEWIILYLHGNSSSRLQSTGIIKYLPYRFSLASFDFIGCGLNHEEDMISLGVRESKQVETIVYFLQKNGFRVIIWGRSMGAATALKYGKAPIIVADSSFRCFKSLCKHIAKQNSPKYVPGCLISCFFPCVFCKLRADIKEKGRYDIDQLDIRQDVKKIDKSTFIIFMSGDQDKLIDKNNSQKLHNLYSGKKYLQIFKGNHNTKRPQQSIKTVMKLITKHILEEQKFEAKDAMSKTKIEIDCNQQQR